MFGGGELAFDPARRRRVGAGKRTEELTFDEGLRQRGAVDVDEGLPGARATVVDDARHLALPRPRLAGEKDSDIERRQECRLAENGDKRGAAADHGFEPQALAQPAHVAVSVRRRSALEQLVGERREVTGEDLGAAVGSVQVEVALAGPGDVDDQAERLLEQRLERRLPAELEETPVQIPFLAIELTLLLDAGKGEGVESLAHAGLAQYPPSRAKKARVFCLPPGRVTLGNRAV